MGGGEKGPIAADGDHETRVGERPARPHIQSFGRDRRRRNAKTEKALLQGCEGALLLQRRGRDLSGEPAAGPGEPVRHRLANGDRRLDHQDAGGEGRVESLPYFSRTCYPQIEWSATMSTATSQRDERIDLRVSADLKTLLSRAASYSGMSLSSFLVSTAADRAKEVVAEHEMLTLTPRDWEAFLS